MPGLPSRSLVGRQRQTGHRCVWAGAQTLASTYRFLLGLIVLTDLLAGLRRVAIGAFFLVLAVRAAGVFLLATGVALFLLAMRVVCCLRVANIAGGAKVAVAVFTSAWCTGSAATAVAERSGATIGVGRAETWPAAPGPSTRRTRMNRRS